MNFQKDAKCKNCAYFFPVFGPSKIEGGEQQLLGGQCRKAPPVVGFLVVPTPVQSIEQGGAVIMPKIERLTAPPHVTADYWCGEFRQRVV